MSSILNLKLRWFASAILLSTGLVLSACVTAPESAAPTAQLPPTPDVEFFPKHGQSRQQQDRDRYECHLWAVKKSGYDPGAEPRQPRVPRQPASTDGSGAVAGAIIGGALGAASSGRHEDRGFNTALGAAAGAMIGAASDEERRRAAQHQAYMNARMDERVMRYRRAMTACLEGRGYTVR